MSRLGEKISVLRAERGLSVKTLAAEAGVGTTTVDRIEHGRGGVYPDTLRKIAVALHAEAPLSEADAVELADGSRMSRAAVLELLRRVRPLLPADLRADPSVSIDRWRIKCHALVDRMLARAASPEQVEIALVAMVSAFEAALPDAPEAPLLTRRGELRESGGVATRTDEHYQSKNTA